MSFAAAFVTIVRLFSFIVLSTPGSVGICFKKLSLALRPPPLCRISACRRLSEWMVVTATARGPVRIAAAQEQVLRPGQVVIRRVDSRWRPGQARGVPGGPEDVERMIPPAPSNSFAP